MKREIGEEGWFESATEQERHVYENRRRTTSRRAAGSFLCAMQNGGILLKGLLNPYSGQNSFYGHFPRKALPGNGGARTLVQNVVFFPPGLLFA